MSAKRRSVAQAVVGALPSRVEAEAFERFPDFAVAHSGNCGTGAVDQETTSDPSGGTCNVGGTKAGEWLEYDVNVASAGAFDFTLRLASAASSRVVVFA